METEPDTFGDTDTDTDTGAAAGCVFAAALIMLCLILAWLFTRLPGGIW